MKQERYVEACQKFAESQRLGPGTGVLLNLGDCYERTRRTASAWAAFLEAAERAQAAGDAEREKYARAHASALEAKLSRLTIKIETRAADSDIEIRRDGVPLSKAAWNVAVPVDPGSHTIEATASGRRKFSASVDVGESGDARVVHVQWSTDSPAALPVAEATPDPRTTAPLKSVPAADAAKTSASEGLNTQGILALGVLGLGVAGVAIGSVYGLMSESKHEDAQAYCVSQGCTQAGLDLMSSARTYGTISTVAFVAGAAGIAGGGLLWFTRTPSAQRPQVAVGPGGVWVRGVW